MFKKLSPEKKISLIVLFTGIVLFALVYWVVRTSYIQAQERYKNNAFNSAQMATKIVDGDRIEDYLLYGPDETYNKSLDLLRELKRAYDLKWLYVVKPDDNNNIIYIFDTDTEITDSELVSKLGDIAGESDVSFNEFMEIYETGQNMDAVIITRTNEWGYLASAYVPVFSSDGIVVAVACADIDMNNVRQYAREQTFLVSAILIVFAILLFSILIRYSKGLLASGRSTVHFSKWRNLLLRLLPIYIIAALLITVYLFFKFNLELNALLISAIGSAFGFAFAIFGDHMFEKNRENKRIDRLRNNLNNELEIIRHNYNKLVVESANTKSVETEIFVSTPIWHSAVSTGDLLILSIEPEHNDYYKKVLSIHFHVNALDKMGTEQNLGRSRYTDMKNVCEQIEELQKNPLGKHSLE